MIFYVAIITPVIHYCMGGLECSAEAEVLDKKGQVIPGLYVAGEAPGGIHGNNRLGGNSLLDCVVFGRVSGKAACMYTFGAGDKFKPCPVPGLGSAQICDTSEDMIVDMLVDIVFINLSWSVRIRMFRNLV